MPVKKQAQRTEPTNTELAVQVVRQRAHWKSRGIVQKVHLRVPVAPIWCDLQGLADMAEVPFNSMACLVWQAGMDAMSEHLTASERRKWREFAEINCSQYFAAHDETGTEHEVAQV